MSTTHPPMRLLAPAALVLLALAAACGGGQDSRTARSATPGSTILDCDTTTGGAAVGIAVADYIKRADPVPQRYLSAVGAGSTPMPEAGFRAMQDKGPTYLYPVADTAAQAKVKAKLLEVGPYTSLLVTYGGMQVAANGNDATVRVGGQYVGGEYDGRVAPVRAVRLRCEGSTWVVASADEERST